MSGHPVHLIPVLSATDIRRDFANTITCAVDAGGAEPFREALGPINNCIDPIWLENPPLQARIARAQLEQLSGNAIVIGLIARSAITSVIRALPVQDRLSTALRMLDRGRVLRSQCALLFSWDDQNWPALGLAGSWATFGCLIERVKRLASEPIPILVTGETGTGKDLVAQGLHRLGIRRAARFLALNVTEVVESLLESELFGHVRGAFTGAVNDRPGFFEAAGQGTAFLDEIGELSGAAQAKLLRVIEEHQVRPVGSNDFRLLRCRVITATHRDLAIEVAAGRFRADLYYRLRGSEIQVASLRNRTQDLLPLAERFAGRITLRRDMPVSLASDAKAAILSHPWPGNVRELRQAVESAAANADGRIEAIHLPAFNLPSSTPEVVASPLTVAEVERAHIIRALEATNGNKTSASRILGLTRQSLQRRIARLRIIVPAAIKRRAPLMASAVRNRPDSVSSHLNEGLNEGALNLRARGAS